MTIRTIELFAGVGGFRCGLTKHCNQFEIVWANQWEPRYKNQFAYKCYLSHFSDDSSHVSNKNIEDAVDEVPQDDIDLIVGGFPCQDYSVAATQAKGICGKKGVLWWSIIKIIERCKPKYVLLENVDRLLKSPSSQRGRDFAIMLRCLSDLHYSVEWRVINAADYGSVQRRRRVFIFAASESTKHHSDLRAHTHHDIILKDGFFSQEFPVKTADKDGAFSEVNLYDFDSLVTISNHFTGRFYNSGVMIDGSVFSMETIPNSNITPRNLETILQKNVSERYYQDDYLEEWKTMKGPKKLIRVSKNGTHYPYVEGGIPFPDPIDRPGRTMLTTEGSRNRSSHIIMDPETGRYRTLTPEECEAMNGFEIGWTKDLTERQRYFVMGNALVVDLIDKMGAEISRLYAEDSLMKQ